MFGFTRFTSIVSLAFLLSSCATNVNVDFDQAVDFSRLKTYSILARGDKDDKDPRLDSVLMDKRIVAAINTGLKAKSYAQQDNNADIKVKYRIDVKQEIESDSSGISIGFGSFSRNVGVGVGYKIPSADVQSYDRGVLTIDMISGKTGQLIWRGSSSRRLYDGSTPEASDKLINSIVDEILKEFPPKK